MCYIFQIDVNTVNSVWLDGSKQMPELIVIWLRTKNISTKVECFENKVLVNSDVDYRWEWKRGRKHFVPFQMDNHNWN